MSMENNFVFQTQSIFNRIYFISGVWNNASKLGSSKAFVLIVS